ncbi:MAG TPA: MFS transporter [Vicinamibacterales bacterium]|nr:MFS transporter [Vicinamibacterales bacterium]
MVPRDTMPLLMDEGNRRYPGWKAALACSAGAFFASFPYHSFAIFLLPISQEFGWSRESVATAFAVMAVVAAAGAPIIGRVVDRLGARPVVVAALMTIGLGMISLSKLTRSLDHLYAICAVIGFASIGASGVAYSRVIFGWFDRHRGRALGTMLAGGMVSAIVLPPIVVRIILFFGWPAACVALGVAIILIGVPVVIGFLRERPAAPDAGKTAASGATIGEALRSRLFWTLLVVVFGAAMMMSGALVHTSALLTDRGLSPDRAAMVMSMMGAANLMGRLLTGWLLDRHSAPRVAAVLLTGGALGGVLMASADSFGVALVAGFLIGAGSGGEYDINPYLLSRYFGLRSLGTLYGFNWMALGLASAIGPIVMGRAYDATGSYAVILSQLAMVTLVVAALILTLPGQSRAHVSAQGVAK